MTVARLAGRVAGVHWPLGPFLVAGMVLSLVRGPLESAGTQAAARLTDSSGPVQAVSLSPDGGCWRWRGSTARCGCGTWPGRGLRPRSAGRCSRTGRSRSTRWRSARAGSCWPRGLLAASRDDKVWLWNVSRPAAARPDGVLTGATDWVNAVAFSPDGTQLAAGSSDGDALVWNLARRPLVASLPHPQPVTSLAWAGRHLITGDADGVVRTWALPTPALLTGGPVNDLAYAPGGLLAVASTDLQLWRGRALIAAAGVGKTFVNAVAAHGDLLAAGYGDGRMQLWRITRTTLVPAGPPVTGSVVGLSESVAFSPDGDLLAEGGDDGRVRLWDVSDPARPRLLAVADDAGIQFVFSVAFSPDGRLLAAASSSGLTQLWDVAGGLTRVGPALGQRGSYAYAAVFSPDGRLLAVGSADRTVRLWDTSTRAAVREVCATAGQPLTRREWATFIPGLPFRAVLIR
jgi:WD40 repeat protein